VADAVLASIALRVGIGLASPDPSTRARAIDHVDGDPLARTERLVRPVERGPVPARPAIR